MTTKSSHQKTIEAVTAAYAATRQDDIIEQLEALKAKDDSLSYLDCLHHLIEENGVDMDVAASAIKRSPLREKLNQEAIALKLVKVQKRKPRKKKS